MMENSLLKIDATDSTYNTTIHHVENSSVIHVHNNLGIISLLCQSSMRNILTLSLARSSFMGLMAKGSISVPDYSSPCILPDPDGDRDSLSLFISTL
jgi:hypothetical protein